MRRLIFEKEERETFYRKLIELNHKLQEVLEALDNKDYGRAAEIGRKYF